MVQTVNAILRAEESPHASAHPSTRTISGGERRDTSPPVPRPRCKAHAQNRGHFKPAQDREEVPLKAREVSVYRALEATNGITEGDDGREKVESVKRARSYDLSDGRFNRLESARS